MLRTYRKPLVVLTPKSLLRHPDATSSMDSLLMGIFREVLYDRRIKNNEEVTRVVFCTGKIFYEAQKARDEQTPGKIAIVRIEQLYPYPESQVQEVFRRYPNAKEFVWLQEEPENMGALRYMEDRIEEQLPSYAKFKTIARPESPSPAEGLMKMHTKQQADLVNKSLSADLFA
ncbi:MAG TPA: 2-oxoglutarate dehydrogenase E1 component, partial [Leptospiraceae bacterium]|nr:2-oxoglutarate dehydrogenase E1 component [Leptospiraceae bacterium]